MERVIKETADGSKTLYIKDLNESYHSNHGAVAEAQHVFIKNGYNLINNCHINILEMGFGTGLNVLATLNEFLKSDKNHTVSYFTLEKYPLKQNELAQLHYENHFPHLTCQFEKLHNLPWNVEAEVMPGFWLKKIHCDFFELKNFELPPIDLVYFDCFGARVQPDLWDKNLLEMVTAKMAENAVFTTYASKGSVRRTLQDLGLQVNKVPGPPGKREMMIARKTIL